MTIKTIPRQVLPGLAFEKMKRQARTGLFRGTLEIYDQVYLAESRWILERYECVAVFTRDSGHHSSGWWKNPDYERCWHLSLSFPGGRNPAAIEEIVTGLFGEGKKWIWVEPPYSRVCKAAEVWHYRLFADEHWQAIKPRGEVYTREFTEAGWKSWSAARAEENEKRKRQQERTQNE